MTRLATIVLAVALVLGCNFEVNVGDQTGEVLTDPGPKKDRLASFEFAEDFLETLDRNEETYSDAAPFLRKTTPRLVWNTTVSSLRSWAGNFEERKAQGYGYTEALDGAPPGHYFVIQYNSRFSNGKATEKVVVSFDSSGYKIAGYHLSRTWSTSEN